MLTVFVVVAGVATATIIGLVVFLSGFLLEQAIDAFKACRAAPTLPAAKAADVDKELKAAKKVKEECIANDKKVWNDSTSKCVDKTVDDDKNKDGTCNFDEFKAFWSSTSGLGGYGNVTLKFLKAKLGAQESPPNTAGYLMISQTGYSQ